MESLRRMVKEYLYQNSKNAAGAAPPPISAGDHHALNFRLPPGLRTRAQLSSFVQAHSKSAADIAQGASHA